MATAAEIQQFAEEHRDLLTYGSRFNRGVRDAVARAWDVVTRLGREDAADRFLDEALYAAGNRPPECGAGCTTPPSSTGRRA
jgi:hypothetical protein